MPVQSEAALENGLIDTLQKMNYEYVVEYCENKQLNISLWKGVLMAADHYASALEEKMWNMYKNNYNMFCKLFPE